MIDVGDMIRWIRARGFDLELCRGKLYAVTETGEHAHQFPGPDREWLADNHAAVVEVLLAEMSGPIERFDALGGNSRRLLFAKRLGHHEGHGARGGASWAIPSDAHWPREAADAVEARRHEWDVRAGEDFVVREQSRYEPTNCERRGCQPFAHRC